VPLNQEGLANEEKSGGFKFRPKSNNMRVLPPTKKYFEEDISFFAYRQWTHFGVGPENSPPVACLRDGDLRANCPLCVLSRKLKDSPVPEQQELGKRIVAKPRYFLNLLDVDFPKEIQQVEVGTKIYEGIKAVATNRSYGDVLDLKKGRTFDIHLTPGDEHPSKYNQYSVTPHGEPSSVKEILPAGWLEKIESLVTLKRALLSLAEVSELAQSMEAVQGVPVTSHGTPPSNVTTRPVQQAAPQQAAPQQAAPQQAAPQQAAPQQAAPQQAAPQQASAQPGGKPSCFGDDYEPGQARCKECAFRDPCLAVYCGR